MGAESHESLLRERWELGGRGVIACLTAGPSGLASVFQPPGSRAASVHKCLLVRLQGKGTADGFATYYLGQIA